MTDAAGTTNTGTEAADLLAALSEHRGFLRHTLKGMTDGQLAEQTTASVLCLGGIVKHLTQVERNWARFVVEGPRKVDVFDPQVMAAHQASFRMEADDSGDSLLAAYDAAVADTDALVATVDLDSSQPLPEAPWFPPDGRWTARRVFLHLLAETAQHAGHADIIRESIDGQKTMG